ncbi:arginase family protein [Brevibacillus nitrificans]|uniref:arginase family protein n=1 Tax=Brevibacillus nitrificans TaxID=651560 RepID=UPI002625C6C5|nr:arginase family protein [Brevibacillus nitrificans]MED1795594.1 arginase family protein [Brevibacillus nitrificans]
MAIKVNVVGIPHFAGAYVSGTELAPDALRKAGLAEKMQGLGLEVQDTGNLKLPDYLPRHNIPPVRNWPAPRMLWDLLTEEARGWLKGEDFALLLGGDCSTIVGTAAAFSQLYGEKAYLLVIDGHFDAVRPTATRCIGAAGMGLWFLLQGRDMWIADTGWTAERMTVIGCQEQPVQNYGVEIVTLAQLRSGDLLDSVRIVLEKIPADAKLLVHFDVDVMDEEAMAAAYAPSKVGLSLAEAERLVTAVVQDRRVVGLEVTEFSALRDTTGEQAERLVHLLANVLSTRARAASSDTLKI